MQLFRRMGPRVILVSHEGQLEGLVTVKDVLQHEATVHHRESVSASASGSRPMTPANGVGGSRGHRRNADGMASNDSWAQRWASFEEDDRGHGLEIALEEGWSWVRIRGSRVYNVAYEYLRRLRGGNGGRAAGEGRGREDFGYEMEETPG